MTLASCSLRRGDPQWGERSKRDIGGLLAGREKHRPVSEVRVKLAEREDTMACKPAHSWAFQIIWTS